MQFSLDREKSMDGATSREWHERCYPVDLHGFGLSRLTTKHSSDVNSGETSVIRYTSLGAVM